MTDYDVESTTSLAVQYLELLGHASDLLHGSESAPRDMGAHVKTYFRTPGFRPPPAVGLHPFLALRFRSSHGLRPFDDLLRCLSSRSCSLSGLSTVVYLPSTLAGLYSHFSLPILEYLSLIGDNTPGVNGDELEPLISSQTSPSSAGILESLLCQGFRGTARQLFNLPNRLHIRKLEPSWYQAEDLRFALKLVVARSGAYQ